MPHTKEEIENYIKEYLTTLTPEEMIAYNIAKEHLGSSFDIEKSIGFIDFLQVKNK
tara:strand:+ start:286 stop:453 length:168 start_codon:yes stop_codon:yes gene_type:complete